MSGNLPDNFGSSIRCDRCGGFNHPSGTVVCRCPELNEHASEQTTALVKLAEDAEGRGDWAAAWALYTECAGVAEERAG